MSVNGKNLLPVSGASLSCVRGETAAPTAALATAAPAAAASAIAATATAADAATTSATTKPAASCASAPTLSSAPAPTLPASSSVAPASQVSTRAHAPLSAKKQSSSLLTSLLLPAKATLRLTAIAPLGVALVLSGCSIEQSDNAEAKIEVTKEVKNPEEMTPVERFIYDCDQCVLGDISKLSELITTYHSTYTRSNEYTPDSFLYQHIEPTQAFERCAQKAMLEGDRTGFDNMIIRPGRVARIARYFYAQDDATQGAFWLQRIINTQGENHGFEVAGRIFIQDMRTIDVGVRLLEQSARLGNRNARQMLMGLMNPGSSYYQEITRNAPQNDDMEENEALQQQKELQSLEKERAERRAARRQARIERHERQSQANRAQAQANIEALSQRTYTDDADANATSDSDAFLESEDKSDLDLGRSVAPASRYTQAPRSATPNDDDDDDAEYDEDEDIDSIEAALHSNDAELNTPLSLYEHNAPAAAATATASDRKQRSTQSVPLTPQQRNRMQHQERLKALEALSQEATKRVHERNMLRSKSNSLGTTLQRNGGSTAPAATATQNKAPHN
ncbi:MAG: hypothetical protein H9847_01880 [Candidatus Anaerobiospirillum pullicola]|uniref:Uncharacterized protein n=1 Tax=Candidatus Anaerobiospirillum pullicola TaxID=2838451 RepID=A0A948WYJ8_9GAMM|nr:hypothetical protein [Candidatus Anaerobiospirillum pullicola]